MSGGSIAEGETMRLRRKADVTSMSLLVGPHVFPTFYVADSQRYIYDDPKQAWLPFESEEELQSAQAEAQAEAEQTIEEYTVKRHKRNKIRRDESFPEHLPRVEKIVEAPDEMKNCPEHGERKIIGYDVTNTFPMPKYSFRPLHPVVMWKSFLSVDSTSTR
jgi:hypothetical protein